MVIQDKVRFKVEGSAQLYSFVITMVILPSD